MSIIDLLLTSIRQGRDYVSLILRMGRAEMGQEMAKAGRGSAFALVALVVGVSSFPFLLMAAVEILIDYGFRPVWAFTMIGGGLLAIALIFGLVAMAQFKSIRLRPERTLMQLRRFEAAMASKRPSDVG